MRILLCSIAAVSSSIAMSTLPSIAQGMGFSGGPPGMQNMGGRRHQQNQQASEPEKVTYPPDDAAVLAATPPTADAKLLTKVGWCEVQVFGHSCSDAGLAGASLPVIHMHLSDRLMQLNQKLNFRPGKKGVQLMDSVDDLVAFTKDNAKKPPEDIVRSSVVK